MTRPTRKPTIALLMSSALLTSFASLATELKVVKPAKVGMSAERLQRVDEMAKRYVKDGKYSGVVTMVARKGKVVHLNAHGNFGVDDARPMQTDTLFRIFSMTKPVTAVAAMMLYEEGKFQLFDPVSKYLPEFAEQKILRDGELVDPKSPMTMHQLLTHTAGLTYGNTPDNPVDLQYAEAKLFESKDLNDFTQKLAEIPLRFEPGTRYHYSVAFDVVGAVIEKLSGMPLDEFYQQRIFNRLGMTDTFFEVPADKLDRLASDQYWDEKANKVVALPKDRQRDFGNVSLFIGGGGLVSSISDYMRFSQMVLNGGEYQGERLLSRKTVEFLGMNHLTPEVRAEGVGQYPSADLYRGQSMAFGYGVVTEPNYMPSISSKGELSWAGVAGTKFWIDPEEEIIGIALVQLYRSPWPLRFDLKVATYQALDD